MHQLSADQDAALTACMSALTSRVEARLAGPAGSGKTFLMHCVVAAATAEGWEPVLAAPTGRAARRLGQSGGLPAVTIHKLMYTRCDTSEAGTPFFSKKRQPLTGNHVLVLDEASMIDVELYREINMWREAGCDRRNPHAPRILYVGDREQLEPVRGTWGPDLTNPTAALAQVHRQAQGNPIISLATAVREDRGDTWIRDWNSAQAAQLDARVTFGHGLDHAVRWYLERRDSSDAALITYTHVTRRAINYRVKQMRGTTHARIAVGDRLLARVNASHLDIMNGDVFTVASVDPVDVGHPSWLSVSVVERSDPILVNLDLFEKEPGEFWRWRAQAGDGIRELPFVHVWGGEALTVHVAQGSQWDNVGFVWCDTFSSMRRRPARQDAARRLLYTAVTRAVERLAIFAV